MSYNERWNHFGEGVEEHNKRKYIGWNKLCTKNINGGMSFSILYPFNFALLGKQSWNSRLPSVMDCPDLKDEEEKMEEVLRDLILLEN